MTPLCGKAAVLVLPLFIRCLVLQASVCATAACQQTGASGSSRSFQLDRHSVAQVWQPMVHGDRLNSCLAFENRSSEFPIGPRLTAGPSWLALQLKQSVMVERITVNGWSDGRPEPVISNDIRVLGALRIPLRVKFENACNTNMDALIRNGDWKAVLHGASRAPISYILLNSAQPLSWESIVITGRRPPLELVTSSRNDRRSHCQLSSLLELSQGDHVCFDVRVAADCANVGSLSVDCFVKSVNGSVAKVKKMPLPPPEEAGLHKFEFEAHEMYHDGWLLCASSRSGTGVDPRSTDTVWEIERTLEFPVTPRSVSITASPVWVAGYPIRVTFASSESYPDLRHRCWIVASSSQWNLVALATTSRAVLNNNSMTLIDVESVYEFSPTIDMGNGSIWCETQPLEGQKTKTVLMSEYKIGLVSEPCTTEIKFLGANPVGNWYKVNDTHGEVRVTSHGCATGHWPVSHVCNLAVPLSGGELLSRLRRTEQTNSTSTHLLPITQRMTKVAWTVKCHVNQSGVVYTNTTRSNRSSQPSVYYQSNLNVRKQSIEPKSRLLIIELATGESVPPVSAVECSHHSAINSHDIDLKVQQLKDAANATNSLSIWTFGVRLPKRRALVFDSPVTISCQTLQIHGGNIVFKGETLLTLPSVYFDHLDDPNVFGVTASTTSDPTSTLMILIGAGLLCCIIAIAVVAVAFIKRQTAALLATTSGLTIHISNEVAAAQRQQQLMQMQLQQQSHLHLPQQRLNQLESVIQMGQFPHGTSTCTSSTSTSSRYPCANGAYELVAEDTEYEEAIRRPR